MIINGGSRSNGGFWGNHLQDTQEKENGKHNVRADVVEMTGVVAQSVDGFFREVGAMAAGSRCIKHFYQANIDPLAHEKLTREQWLESVDTLEKKLGLTGQPRLIVEHEKSDGRVHWHIVWSRIDEDGKTISDSMDYQKHQRTSRELEERFGLERGKSTLEPDRAEPRPDRRPTAQETFRGHKTGIDPKVMKKELTELWRTCDGGKAFVAAIEDRGYILAQGDKPALVVIDHAGDVHGLARRLQGVNTAEMTKHLADIDRSALPTVKQAQATQQERFRDGNKFDRTAAARAWREGALEVDQARTGAAAPASEPDHAPELAPEPEAAPTLEASATVTPQDRVASTAIHTETKVWEPTPDFLKARAAFDKAFDKAFDFAADAKRGPEDTNQIGRTFVEALNKDGYVVAEISKREAAASRVDHERAAATGGYAAEFKAGEFVLVAREGQTYRLGYGLCQDATKEINETLRDMKGIALPSRTEARDMQRKARNTDVERRSGGDSDRQPGKEKVSTKRATGAVMDVAGKLADMAASIFSFGAAAPPVENKTPDQELREEIAAIQQQATESLRELQAGMGDQQQTKSDHANATREDLTNRASGNGDAALEKERRDREDWDRHYGGGRER